MGMYVTVFPRERDEFFRGDLLQRDEIPKLTFSKNFSETGREWISCEAFEMRFFSIETRFSSFEMNLSLADPTSGVSKFSFDRL